ncbi:MAG: I78 family peptidase inhibitor [Oceanicaulis sp.]
MRRWAVLALGASLVAACQTMAGPETPEDEPGYNYGGERGVDAGEGSEDGSPTCPAAAYQVLVGQSIGEVHTGSLPEPHRIYGEGDMVTMDYRLDRLNIVTGEGGVVVEVKCG